MSIQQVSNPRLTHSSINALRTTCGCVIWSRRITFAYRGNDRRRPNAAWQKHERSSNGIAWLIRDQCCPYPHTSRLGLSRLHWSLFRHRWKLEQSHAGMLKGHLSGAGLYRNTLSGKLEENPPLIKLDLSPRAPLHLWQRLALGYFAAFSLKHCGTTLWTECMPSWECRRMLSSKSQYFILIHQISYHHL